MSTIRLILALALSGCDGTTPETPVEQTPPPEPAPETYKVKIHRPFTAGQVITVDVEAHQTVKGAVVDGEQKQAVGAAEAIDLHLVGDVKIDEVSPDGRAAVATLTVTTFVNPSNQDVILPAGAVVHATRVDGVLQPTLEGGTLTADQSKLLLLAFPMERPGSRLGDELFGTPDPKAVGDTWPFNRAYVVDDLREDGWATSESGLDGTVKLNQVAPCGKTQCLELQIEMKAANTSMVAVEGASDVGVGELHSTITLQVPVDETTPVHLEDAETTLDFAAKLTTGEDQATHRLLAISRDRRATYTPKE
jgi:hypothetical protein